MDQLTCAYLSHTHYWYEVGMLKVPAMHRGRLFSCAIHSGGEPKQSSASQVRDDVVLSCVVYGENHEHEPKQ